jgi:hypothetical protein
VEMWCECDRQETLSWHVQGPKADKIGAQKHFT